MSNIKVGSKMLYCKVAGDKSTEEVVEVVGIQSDAEDGGVTIYIPSLKRERDTHLSRLSDIVEKKEKLDTFFGKPKFQLPARPDIGKMKKQFTNRVSLTFDTVLDVLEVSAGVVGLTLFALAD